jgi:hypothetical protein
VNQDQQRSQSKRRDRYDEEFKRNAVELLESGERSAVQLGRELGVSDWFFRQVETSIWPARPSCSRPWGRPKPNRGTGARTGGGQPPTRHFKKALTILGQETQQLYQMTEALHQPPDCDRRAELCRTFGLSRSGLQEHALRVQGLRCLQDKVLAKQIKSIFDQSWRTYGARRLPADVAPSRDPLRQNSSRASDEAAGTPASAEASATAKDDPECTS